MTRVGCVLWLRIIKIVCDNTQREKMLRTMHNDPKIRKYESKGETPIDGLILRRGLRAAAPVCFSSQEYPHIANHLL